MAQTLGVTLPRSAREPDPDAPLVWVVAFSVGVLIDAVHFAEPPFSFYSLATIAAAGVVLGPRSRGRLLALSASLAFATFWYLPEIWNHWVLVGAIGAILTGARMTSELRGRRLTNAELTARLAPFLRVAFLATFGLAAFAKLNTGFLDVASSCATWIIDRVPLVPAVPEDARTAVVVLALVTELGIPVLLIVRRTRLLGVAVGFAFHLFTALAGHASFAGFAWSFYFLFLPRPVLDRLVLLARQSWHRAVSRTSGTVFGLRRPGPLFWPGAGVAWVALVAIIAGLPVTPTGRFQRIAAALLFAGWGLWSGALLLRALRDVGPEGRRLPPARGFWRVGLGGLVALAVLASSALSPYLGFKTQYSLTMYSDLRTEGGQWNHLVVPETVRIGTWQDDLVEVIATEDEELDSELRLARGGPVVLPVLELRRLSHRYPDAAVTYRYAGTTSTASHLGEEPVIGDDLPWIMRKVARFRPAVEPTGTRCQH